MTFRRIAVGSAVLAWAVAALAYPVGPALSLDRLVAEADLVFKGVVLTNAPVQDDWFKPYAGFTATETAFKIISVLKGDAPAATLRFHHYDDSAQRKAWGFQPQQYHFEASDAYLVFAKHGAAPGDFRQLAANHTAKGDQGALLCADDQPITAGSVKEAIWREMTRMLTNANATNVGYAIHQLDQMSSKLDSFGDTQDFDRTNVVRAIHGLMTAPNAQVAETAIAVVGSHNPYLSDERTIHWLATVGSGDVPGMGKMDPKMVNVGGELYWPELVAVADSQAPSATRVRAIEALGLVREPALRMPLERWLADPAPAIRAAAAVLLADFPGADGVKRLTLLADDPAPEVRVGVARAIGFSQQAEAAGTLAWLLADKETNVRTAAAMSLISFSPKHPAIAAILRANLDNEEFKPMFLIALAREHPGQYLDGLATAIEQKSQPRNFWGGQIPAFTAWEILFRYLQAQAPETVKSGKLDRYLDAIEQVGNYSSSEPRDIYAFYVQRGMTGRAQRYREAARKAVNYDLDYYFKEVDQNPSLYLR